MKKTLSSTYFKYDEHEIKQWLQCTELKCVGVGTWWNAIAGIDALPAVKPNGPSTRWCVGSLKIFRCMKLVVVAANAVLLS